MTNAELLGFRYRFEHGTGDRTLLLLHGTGADENDLVPLGRSLDAGANLLSPRGKVVETGMPRFFRRHAEGILDIEDLKARTHELVEFIDAATKEHDLDRRHIVGVGYSNGANIAASVLLLHPSALEAAMLLRPMFPYEPDDPPDLREVAVFIASGRKDPLIDPEDAARLARLLEEAGADVDISFSDGGHPLEAAEVEAAREWLGRN